MPGLMAATLNGAGLLYSSVHASASAEVSQKMVPLRSLIRIQR